MRKLRHREAKGLTPGHTACLKPPGLLARVVMSWRGCALLEGIQVTKQKAARRSNQSILKEINPQYSLQGVRLKLQYFGHLR